MVFTRASVCQCSVVKLLGGRVMQNKHFVLILTKLGLRIALEDIAAVPGKLRYMSLFMP